MGPIRSVTLYVGRVSSEPRSLGFLADGDDVAVRLIAGPGTSARVTVRRVVEGRKSWRLLVQTERFLDRCDGTPGGIATAREAIGRASVVVGVVFEPPATSGDSRVDEVRAFAIASEALVFDGGEFRSPDGVLLARGTSSSESDVVKGPGEGGYVYLRAEPLGAATGPGGVPSLGDWFGGVGCLPRRRGIDSRGCGGTGDGGWTG